MKAFIRKYHLEKCTTVYNNKFCGFDLGLNDCCFCEAIYEGMKEDLEVEFKLAGLEDTRWAFDIWEVDYDSQTREIELAIMHKPL